ncbi:Jumonji superfamily protein [Mycena kentingensis (nom. inval.)]|nr:Jumonji superfamily protein [Mycena kentingensis (nom. inval.)]
MCCSPARSPDLLFDASAIVNLLEEHQARHPLQRLETVLLFQFKCVHASPTDATKRQIPPLHGMATSAFTLRRAKLSFKQTTDWLSRPQGRRRSSTTACGDTYSVHEAPLQLGLEERGALYSLPPCLDLWDALLGILLSIPSHCLVLFDIDELVSALATFPKPIPSTYHIPDDIPNDDNHRSILPLFMGSSSPSASASPSRSPHASSTRSASSQPRLHAGPQHGLRDLRRKRPVKGVGGPGKYYLQVMLRSSAESAQKLESDAMNGDGASTSTPRGTPSRRGKSPRFASPNPPGPTDSPSTPTPRGTPSRRGKSATPSTPARTSAAVNIPTQSSANSALYSCISIPVVGAIPVNPSDQDDQGSATDSSHAPSRHKSDAPKSRSFDDGADDDAPEDVWADRYRDAGPLVPRSPILDLSTVKTSSVRPDHLPSKGQRLFGLEDCPTFYPTAEEFKDPMAYIRSISQIANDHGICKVVPPPDWKMPFVTDTANFRFKTRLQRLNSVEASSRAKINFLEQLYVWHQQQGNPRVSVPTINNKPLDLYALRKEVRKLGGFYAVTKKKQWSDLGRLLGYSGIPGLSTQLKNSYTRVILPYEEYEAKNAAKEQNKAAPSPKKPVSVNGNGVDKRLSTLSLSKEETPESPLTTSSTMSEPPEEPKVEPKARPRRSTRMSGRASPIPAPVFHDVKKEPKEEGEQNCEICHKKNRGEEMLLCDGCDCGFHMFCLDPPLDAIPKEQWFCYTCLAGTGGDYGFDDGDEHTLASFQARDTEFRKLWFESHPPERDPDAIDIDDSTSSLIGKVIVSESDLETEFWRLVDTQEETVEVEYGADVHSTTHGSAMPTIETHPLNPYSRDPWNLNNIPIVSDSLLRYIKSDISGMTVPWTYVGMTFSTFCWHNEDHYTYSINYMHWGETKTWYGIPGADAEKFEAAIKSEAPDLFQAQPDLLFQLVTLMNPKRVTDAGVRVYACNQRAGEFVITCPKSYHAGFNHGFNFNEAVNFALPDWLPFGRDCVQRYREHRKLPVFSHDELLITITQQSQSIKTAMWVLASLQEMTDRELRDRQVARGQNIKEVLEEEDRPEDQYQCTVCKAFCYLSQITCSCKTTVTCVEHANLLCERPINDHVVLRKRFSDEELAEILNQVATRAKTPSGWQAKLGKVLGESGRPLLRSLRALYSEGDRINYPLPQLASLRKCVGRANEWVDSANSFLIRKQSRKRARRRGRPSAADNAAALADDPGDRPDKGLEELYALLKQVETLGFDCPEITALRTLGQTAEETKKKAAALLAQAEQVAETGKEEFMEECRRLLVDTSSLNVLLDEVVELEKLVDKEQLMRDLETKVDEGSDVLLPLDEVRDLLARARACGLAMDNPMVQALETRLKTGNGWEDRARNLLAQPIKSIEELEEFATENPEIQIDMGVLDRVLTALARARDFEKQAHAWLKPASNKTPRPQIHEVIRLATRSEKEFNIPAVQAIHKTAVIAQDLEAQSALMTKGEYVPANDEDIFRTIEGWRDYARNHLKIFTLPSFNMLEDQYHRHSGWLKGLPWYCPTHGRSECEAIIKDLLDYTRPDDEFPPNDEYFTCICNVAVRPPPPGKTSDAVQCDHCYARFHGDCANNGGSCPFCDHHHWNGSLHKSRSFHFSYLPPMIVNAPDLTRRYSKEYKELEFIVGRVDKLATAVGQFLSYTSIEEHQRPDYLPQVRHYMRKLYRVQFAVGTHAEESYGLDLAGLHRILALRKGPVSERHAQKLAARRREKELALERKKRKIRFTFGQDTDNDWRDGTRCICRGRTPYLINYPAVTCDSCHHKYHAGCVFFPLSNGMAVSGQAMFTCPICLVRKGQVYAHADVRVRPPADLRKAADQYVDVKQMVESGQKDFVFKSLGPPYTKTLFIELLKVTNSDPLVNGKVPSGLKEEQRASRVFRPTVPYRHPHAPPIMPGEPSSVPVPPRAAPVKNYKPATPPPPPWSSSSNGSAHGHTHGHGHQHSHAHGHGHAPIPTYLPLPPLSAPPSVSISVPGTSASAPIAVPDSPPPSGGGAKKRKVEEINAYQEPTTIYPKRRAVPETSSFTNGHGQNGTPTASYRPVTPPPGQDSADSAAQRLSPSLAKIVISGGSARGAHDLSNSRRP